MRKCLLIGLVIFQVFASNATVFNITVQNFQFTPASIPNVLIGDVIQFNWANGSHTTTCDPLVDNTTSLPSGAATWNQNMNSTSTSFSYTVTKVGTYNYVCVPHSSFMAASFVVSSPLPVVLTSFKVKNVNNIPMVSWTTNSELDCNYFSIQKSANGKDFSEVGRVKSVGNSSEIHDYTFSDNQIQTSSVQYLYYMLAIVDKDGKKAYSDVKLYKALSGDQKIITGVGPNPILKNGHLMLEYVSDIDSKMDLSLFDLEGKCVMRSSVTTVKGRNMGHFHLSNLSSGTYTLSVLINGKSESRLINIK